MGNFGIITDKLEQFIRKYYTNELLKGVILFFSIGLLYFIITLFVEYLLWLGPGLRTLLFWVFIVVELGLFVKLIAIPLAQLSKLRKGINHETASKLIGSYFPEVNDKLLNVLQLNQSTQESELLLASIAQKSKELQPIPFKSAVNFKSNIKYLKYAAIPVAILLLSYVTGKINWFSDSYERVINYKTVYNPPAPFQFFVLNKALQAVEGTPFKLRVSTAGEVVPDNAQIQFKGQSYYLQQLAPGEFEYTFDLPSENIDFTLSANDIVSKAYRLEVINTPSLISFEMALDYPSYTKKQDEVLKSTGSAVVPEGTKVTWNVSTRATTEVLLYATDTLRFSNEKKDNFKLSTRLYTNYNYNITASNAALKDYENLAYTIRVVKDMRPELEVQFQKDSLDQQSLYFYGQASDDFGLTKLEMIYYPVDDQSNRVVVPIAMSKSNLTTFVAAFPNQQKVEDGVSYELYFEVSDNDAFHNYKRTKSRVFSYKKRTQDEEEQRQLQEQNSTIKAIDKTFENLQEQDKKLEDFAKVQKEKPILNFNDKKRFNDFIKRQKQQEQLMKGFNKKLQENLEEFQLDKAEDQFKEDLKTRLRENEAQLKKDEKLLEEFEKLKDKINKEEFTQKLEELAKQNKSKKRSMKQLLELTKRFYVMKKAEKIANQLEALSKKQEALSKTGKENTPGRQEDLNNMFDQLQQDIDALKQEDRQLQKPLEIPADAFLQEDIKSDQNDAKTALENREKERNNQNPEKALKSQITAQEKQKKAAKKLKQMSEMMMQMMSAGGGGGDQNSEDIDMLRQILENLIRYSFDQEDLMNTFGTINTDNNNYGKYIVAQSNLKEHFEHIDDSLFALSLRQPKISETVNEQIAAVYFNITKALGQLTENRVYQGMSSQQYAITASNTLASVLSDVLDGMEMSMNPTPGGGSGEGQQLPDIILNQEALNKEMEDAVNKRNQGKSGQSGDKGGGEPPGKTGEKGEKGESGDQSGISGQRGKEGRSNGQDKGGTGGQQGKGPQDGNRDGDIGNGEGGKGYGSKDKGTTNEGYGQGGKEEQNAALFKIYQQQQQLRQALENQMSKEGKSASAGTLIRQMEEVELDLLNYGFTNQTLQKMMDVQHQLLKLENATFIQGQDMKRESTTNKKSYEGNRSDQLSKAKMYFNSTEILNRQSLPLQNLYKKKIQSYFKEYNDQL